MPAGRIIDNLTSLKNIYGLFVGINEYQKGIPPLRGCVRDAESILAGFDLPETHYRLLLDKNATRANILGAVQHAIDKVKERDLFVFSVSAHGTIRYDDFAIITHDTLMENQLGTALSTSYLLSALSQITRKNNGKVLLILDACHAGAMPYDISKYSGYLTQGGMSCLFSSGPNELSYESHFQSNDGESQQGVFTHHLIDALHGNAKDENGRNIVTLRNLYDYVYEHVSAGFKQHPVLIGTLAGNTVLRSW